MMHSRPNTERKKYSESDSANTCASGMLWCSMARNTTLTRMQASTNRTTNAWFANLKIPICAASNLPGGSIVTGFGTTCLWPRPCWRFGGGEARGEEAWGERPSDPLSPRFSCISAESPLRRYCESAVSPRRKGVESGESPPRRRESCVSPRRSESAVSPRLNMNSESRRNISSESRRGRPSTACVLSLRKALPMEGERGGSRIDGDGGLRPRLMDGDRGGVQFMRLPRWRADGVKGKFSGEGGTARGAASGSGSGGGRVAENTEGPLGASTGGLPGSHSPAGPAATTAPGVGWLANSLLKSSPASSSSRSGGCVMAISAVIFSLVRSANKAGSCFHSSATSCSTSRTSSSARLASSLASPWTTSRSPTNTWMPSARRTLSNAEVMTATKRLTVTNDVSTTNEQK
mmetsp:Transcript_6417/g.14804  ORF Transcript_6417/g.14804 Transcript_6417/m.14804 type:complete len:405 (-) Transcript_6417:1779-2993(-)